MSDLIPAIVSIGPNQILQMILRDSQELGHLLFGLADKVLSGGPVNSNEDFHIIVTAAIAGPLDTDHKKAPMSSITNPVTKEASYLP